MMYARATLLTALVACSSDPAALPSQQVGPALDFTLESQPFWLGERIEMTVSDAPPNATFVILGSLNPNAAPSCPNAIAPVCLEVGQYRVLFQGTTSAQGTATVRVTLPASISASQAKIQAAAVRQGVGHTSNSIVADFIDPEFSDIDDDAATDAVELAIGTDPLNFDTDGDGMQDGDEIFEYFTDPFDPDTDDDGITDLVEVSIWGTDPTLEDTDGDQIPDGFEVFVFGSDPFLVDTDGGGIDDGTEFLNGLDPNDPDTDAVDTDVDGVSDADELLLGTDPNDPDTDDDGLTDGEELDLFFTKPLDEDTDNDSLDDGEELDVYATDPLNPDTDDDGLSDGFELFFSADPLNPDTDGGGLLDGDEIDLGLDPTDPTDDPPLP
jgi:hypothetical protein